MATTPPLLQVKLRSPYQSYYEGPATSISARNRVGPFDVLANHAPFFSLLLAGAVTVRTPAETLQFQIQNGILKLKNNQVDIFLNI